MNENWPEIVDSFNPYMNDGTTKEQFLKVTGTALRILGWKRTNGTMKSNYTITDEQNNTISSDIVLYGSTNKAEDNLSVPVIVTSPTVSLDDSITKQMIALFNHMNATVGLFFGAEIVLFFRPLNKKTAMPLVQATYDATDVGGSKICDLFTFSDYSVENVNVECDNLFRESHNTTVLINRIEEILSDDKFVKEIIASRLESEGFIKDYIDSELSKVEMLFDYSSNNNSGGNQKKSGRSKTSVRESSSEKGKIKHDNTRFSFDGGDFLPKKEFVLRVVFRYVKDHPGVTYEELEQQFPSSIISKNRGVVRPLDVVKEWIRENPNVESRYCLKPEEIITLDNGMQLAVHNQWGSKFPNFLRIAIQFYDVKSNQPYSGFESIYSSLDEHKGGIRISDLSLRNFNDKKR